MLRVGSFILKEWEAVAALFHQGAATVLLKFELVRDKITQRLTDHKQFYFDILKYLNTVYFFKFPINFTE